MSNFKKKKNKIIQQKYKKNYVCSGMNRKIHECISSFILVADSSLITKFKNEKYNLNKNLFSGGPSKIISLNHQMSFHNKQSLPHGEQNFSQTGLYLIRKIITSKNFSTFVSLEKKKTIQSQKQQGIKNQINQVNQLNNKTQNNRIEGIMSQVNNKTRTNIFKITNQSKRSYDENTRQLALCPCSVPELLQHKFVPRIFTYVDSQNYKITQKTNVFLNKTYQKIQKQKARTNTTPLTNLFPFYLNKKFNDDDHLSGRVILFQKLLFLKKTLTKNSTTTTTSLGE